MYSSLEYLSTTPYKAIWGLQLNGLWELWAAKRKTVFKIAAGILKWVSIPALLIGSMFSRFAASYELQVDLVICLGAVIWVQLAIRSQEFAWAAGLAAIAVVFSPVALVAKILLLVGLTLIAILGTLFAAFRTGPSLARHS